MFVTMSDLCSCGCGRQTKPGKKFYASGCAVRGRKLNLSAEERQARAERRAALNDTPEHVEQLDKLHRSREHSERLTATNNRNWRNPVYRGVQTARIRAMQPALRELKRAEAKARWADPKFRRKFYTGWLAKFADRTKPSGLHLRVKTAILAAGITEFETHVVVGHYCLDEADCVAKLAIEINGCYWHGCKRCIGTKPTRRQTAAASNDKRRASYLARKGWRLLTLWEHELADLESAVQRILAFMEESDGEESPVCGD